MPSETAAAHAVYSATRREDLPDGAQWIVDQHGPAVLPALVYPMIEPDGSRTWQLKPQSGTVIGEDGKPIKYVSPPGNLSPQLPVVRTVAQPKGVLLVEGVKQALAADAWAPEDWSIYRFCGIDGWSRDRTPTKYLDVVEDLPVVIVPDADAATNPRVFDGATRLGDACREWTSTVSFARIAGTSTAGIDDRLGAIDGDDRRRRLFRRWIAGAKPKPADGRPKPPVAPVSHSGATPRRRINVGADRLRVIEELEAVLRDNFDRRELFSYGGVLCQLVPSEDGPTLERLTDGDLNRLISRSAETVRVSDRGVERHDWPDTNTLKSLAAGHRQYTRLDGVSSVPVVRRDGSIVTTNGYDPETRLLVLLSSDLEGLTVPDHPTDGDLREAKRLLMEDLFVDERYKSVHGHSGFPFKADADVAHAFAALLTPLIRNLVSIVPLCVIDGLTSRVGKGLLIQCLVMVMTGHPPDLSNLPRDDEQELRKLLTSMLLAGRTIIVFDEAHKLNSPVLCQALTAQVWSDRVLGGNKQARLRNVASWYAAGNQVERSGDIANRTYSIRLHTNEPNPQNRTAFKHDLGTWVPAHRAELLRACLILVRAWFDRGRPKPKAVPTVLGGFEQWREVIGGILEVAGVDGFLTSVDQERLAANFEEQCERAHLESLAARFGTGATFTSKQGAVYLATDVDAEAPYGLDRLKDKEDPRSLGRHWATIADVWKGDLRLVRTGQSHGNVAKWKLEQAAQSAASAGGSVATHSTGLPSQAPQTRTAHRSSEKGRRMPTIVDLDEAAA
ncbi:hypothetical protein [Plantibacter sp. RU18]|uniref:hypothetical protein n=2 Tax=unclassified Plantibacter TaxID=2624265 RepID=UPI003D36E470